MTTAEKFSIAFFGKSRLFYSRMETSTSIGKSFNFGPYEGFFRGIKRYTHNGLVSFLLLAIRTNLCAGRNQPRLKKERIKNKEERRTFIAVPKFAPLIS